MEREAFRQRMQQYKQARENNPQLKYWDWKSTVQREPLDGVYEDARFIDQSEPRFELRKGQQYYASPNNLKLMKVFGKTVKVLGPIGEVVQNLFPSEEAEILEDARYKYENALKPKVYADGGIIDEDPPQNTSERPITNFDPKEDLYSNPAYMERARQIQNTYGDNYAKVYEDIINQYNTNYWNLPNSVIKQLDAKAKMQAKDAAVNRYITRRHPAGYDDFEYQINRNLTEIDYPTTRHELGHYVDFNLAKSSNPDYSNSMFAELKRDLSKQKNPLFPDKTDYYSKGTEQKSYMNTLREYMFKTGMINNIGDKVTSKQIKKAIRSLPKDMRSIEAAHLQFATPGQYTKWFNKIPLLGTYSIVNKQFQNYEEDKDKAREQR